MPRSIWKGPFVDPGVIRRVAFVKKSGKIHTQIRIWSRRSTILPDFIGMNFSVYNGKNFIPVLVSEDMVGMKFGEFSPTRTYIGHAGNKKARRR